MIEYNTNELRSGRPQLLRKRGLEIEPGDVQVADYIVNRVVGVEVKEGIDYLESLLSERLNDQLWEMSATFEESWLLVIGIISEIQQHITNLHKKFPDKIKGVRDLRETLISSNMGVMRRTAKTGANGWVRLYIAENREDFVTFMRKLEKRTNDPTGTVRELKFVKRHFADAELLVHVLSCIPGIGPVEATRLLEEIGNIQAIANANPHRLMEIKGIKEKRAWEIYKLFRVTYQGSLNREPKEANINDQKRNMGRKV